jgi:hypothetical protein
MRLNFYSDLSLLAITQPTMAQSTMAQSKIQNSTLADGIYYDFFVGVNGFVVASRDDC